MTQEENKGKNEPAASAKKTAAKIFSRPYSLYDEDFSVSRYLIIFGLSFIIAAALYIMPYLYKWGWIGESAAENPPDLTNTMFYASSLVVVIGVLPLLRLALNGIRQRFIPFELTSAIGILILYGYSIYNMYIGDAAVYFKETAAAISFFLLYEFLAARIIDRALGADETLSFAESPIERRIRILSFVLFAVALTCAGGLAAHSYYFAGGALEDAIIRGAAALLIMGPGSIVFAAHFAVKFAMLLIKKRGITLHDSGLLRKVLDAYVVIFTKSGILTEGSYLVTDIAFESYGTIKPTELLRYAGAVERNSPHPLARALLRQLKEPSAGWPEVTDFKIHDGVGVEGKVGDKTVKAGRRELFAHMDYSLQHKAQTQEQGGNTVIYMGFGDDANGAAYLVDTLRPGMRKMCIDLHERRKLVCLISSDSFQSVKNIAEKCTIKNYVSEASIEEKIVEIRNHQKKGRSVIVVAKPETDEEILKQADVSVVLRSDKKEIPGYIDIAVKPEKLHELSLLVRVARNVLGSIHLDLLWLSIFNIAAIAMLYFNLLNPPLAAALSAASGLLLVMNILRARKAPEGWV